MDVVRVDGVAPAQSKAPSVLCLSLAPSRLAVIVADSPAGDGSSCVDTVSMRERGGREQKPVVDAVLSVGPVRSRDDAVHAVHALTMVIHDVKHIPATTFSKAERARTYSASSHVLAHATIVDPALWRNACTKYQFSKRSSHSQRLSET